MNIIQLETKESKKNIKTHSYKETELDEWFRQNCVFRTDHTIENTALYNDYVKYCKERATPSVALRDFTKEIPIVVALNWGMRIIKGRNAKGIIFRGLCLRDNKEISKTPYN